MSLGFCQGTRARTRSPQLQFRYFSPKGKKEGTRWGGGGQVGQGASSVRKQAASRPASSKTIGRISPTSFPVMAG